jgi:hypothetical protein
MAVEIDASSNYSISKTFNQAYQYALFSFNQNLLQVGFEDFGTAINDTGIVAHLKTLPDQFDPSSTDVVKKYRSFFKTIGTHVITGANYGGRFQLVSAVSFLIFTFPPVLHSRRTISPLSAPSQDS